MALGARGAQASAGAWALGCAWRQACGVGRPAARARGTGPRQASAQGARYGRCARDHARPGRAARPWTVHLVHSACFWLGLTQYCS